MRDPRVVLEVCPRCEQGQIYQAVILATAEEILVCEECDAMWQKDEKPSVNKFADLGTYLNARGLTILWTELDIGEHPHNQLKSKNESP